MSLNERGIGVGQIFGGRDGKEKMTQAVVKGENTDSIAIQLSLEDGKADAYGECTITGNWYTYWYWKHCNGIWGCHGVLVMVELLVMAVIKVLMVSIVEKLDFYLLS